MLLPEVLQIQLTARALRRQGIKTQICCTEWFKPFSWRLRALAVK